MKDKEKKVFWEWPNKTFMAETRAGWIGRQWQWFLLLRLRAQCNEPEGKLRNDDQTLRRLAMVEPRDNPKSAVFRKLWSEVKAEFKSDGQWLILPELWKQLQERNAFSKAQSERGKKSAEARARREKSNVNKISWNGKEWFPSELEKALETANSEIRRLAQQVLNVKSATLREQAQSDLDLLKGQRDSMKRALLLPSNAIEDNKYSHPQTRLPLSTSQKIPGAPAASMERSTDLDQLPASQFSDSGLDNALKQVVESIAEIRSPSASRDVYYDGERLRPQFVEALNKLEERERELNAEKFQRSQLANADADDLKKKSSKTRKSSTTSARQKRTASITTIRATESSLSGSQQNSDAALQPANG